MRTHILPPLVALVVLAAPSAPLAQVEIQKAPPGAGNLVAPPDIQGLLSIPGFGTAHPGTRVYLKGENFHQGPGVIVIYGRVGGQEKGYRLQDVVWKSDAQANGVVPLETVEFSGDHPVYLQMTRKAQTSNRRKMGFDPILLIQASPQDQQQMNIDPQDQQQVNIDPQDPQQMVVDPQEPIQMVLDGGESDENIDDWNPNGEDAGQPSVRVTQPTFNAVISPSQGSVTLRLVHGGGVAPPKVTLEFARLTEAPKSVGDIKLPSEHSHMWTPTHAYQRSFTAEPFTLNLAGPAFRGQEGRYQVRARGLTPSQAMGNWSPWKPFCIGSQQGCTQLSQLAKGALGTQNFIDQQVDKQFARMGLGTAKTRGPTAHKTATPALGSRVQPRLGRAPGEVPGQGSSQSARMSSNTALEAAAASKQTQGASRARVAAVAKPKLTLVAAPAAGAPDYEAGKPFTLAFTIRNSDDVESDPVRTSLSCEVVSGGPKCFAKKSRMVDPLEPNQEAKVEYTGLVLDAGDYGLQLDVSNGPSQRLRIRVEPAEAPFKLKSTRPRAVQRAP